MQTRRLATALAALVFAGLAGAAERRFGELPAGAISTSELHEVSAEICRDHLFDPASVDTQLPTGYRLTTVADAAQRDPALESLLQKLPKLRHYALGSLCVVSAGSFDVDGALVHTTAPLPLAFWWAAAEGPRHAAMRGKTSWVQLRSWYASTLTNRAAVLRTDPMAEFVDIQVERVQPDRWRLHLALPGETVTAEVSTSGVPVPSRADQPGFMSVPMSGRAADFFSVFTYSGHHHQPAQGAWRAAGTGVFREAFSIDGEAAVFGTHFQSGWRARAGLYRFSSR